MTSSRRQGILLAITALLFSTLACRAVTRLIIPDTPTPLPPTPVPPPTPTPTLPVETSCPLPLEQILEASFSYENSSHENTDEEIYLATYFVNGDELSRPFHDPVPDDLKDEQGDRATHQNIWEFFTRLIPLDQREFVSGYAIVTDGGGEVLAAVVQAEDDPTEWILEVDILDSADKYALTFTLLHEFAHLMTLNSAQVPPSIPIFEHPEDNEIYQRELASCPNYFPGEGCSNVDSYINQFFDTFWFDLYAEWQEIDSLEDDESYYDLLDNFYDLHEDQFLTEYAPTSPVEDIAESFAFFVLSPKPQAASIGDEKVLFFYQYPELRHLRNEILEGICAEFSQ